MRQGNIRRVTIKSKEGKTLIEIPLTFGVVGALFLPTLDAIAALVTKRTIVVEKVEEDDKVEE